MQFNILICLPVGRLTHRFQYDTFNLISITIYRFINRINLFFCCCCFLFVLPFLLIRFVFFYQSLPYLLFINFNSPTEMQPIHINGIHKPILNTLFDDYLLYISIQTETMHIVPVMIVYYLLSCIMLSIWTREIK